MLAGKLAGVGSKLYLGWGVLMIVLYLLSESSGKVYAGTDERARMPPNARSAPGGYRSVGFWASGWHGGK